MRLSPTAPRPSTDPFPPPPALRRVPVAFLHEFLRLAEERGIPPKALGASAAQIRDELARRGEQPR